MKRLAAFLSLMLLSPQSLLAQDLTVFAAASLRGALDEIAAEWPAPVRLSFGGSGTIARQIAAGAAADVVILAHPDWMDWLASQHPLAQRRDLATNSLVLIGPAGSTPMMPEDLPGRLGDGRLAMGQRDAVPAGTYAYQWLQSVGLWDRLAPRIAQTDNVRAALALVAQGAAPFGIVYASDALAEPRVTIVYDIPAAAHDAIAYPAAALSEAGEEFLPFLHSDTAADILLKHGFTPVMR